MRHFKGAHVKVSPLLLTVLHDRRPVYGRNDHRPNLAVAFIEQSEERDSEDAFPLQIRLEQQEWLAAVSECLVTC